MMHSACVKNGRLTATRGKTGIDGYSSRPKKQLNLIGFATESVVWIVSNLYQDGTSIDPQDITQQWSRLCLCFAIMKSRLRSI